MLASIDDVDELALEGRDGVVGGRAVVAREVRAAEVLELIGVLAELAAAVLGGWLELPPQAAKLIANAAASIDAWQRLSGS